MPGNIFYNTIYLAVDHDRFLNTLIRMRRLMQYFDVVDEHLPERGYIVKG